jgi:hypothetical protein
MGCLGVGASAMACVVAAVLAPSAAAAFDPAVEAKNFAKTQERATIYSTPQYQLDLRRIGAQNSADALAIQAGDPERSFQANLCAGGQDGCAGDVRLYDWGPKGYGVVRKVLYTARNGATISGHVWATKAGPAQRPGIVITNGSVQANEPLYWFAAQTLAKAGYVVLTWDPQGQGQSDTRGEAPDENEGFPAQSDGRPFFDGTEDALTSSCPRPTSPTSRCRAARRARATRPSRTGASRPASTPPPTRCGTCSIPRASASRATPTAPPACRTSGRPIRA